MTVTLADPLVVALTSASSKACLVLNPYGSVLQGAASALLSVGVAPVAVPAGNVNPQYFWAQTWGPAAVLADATTQVVGSQAKPGATGAVGVMVGAATADIVQPIGITMMTAASAETRPVFLQIAP
jgi:hypothetical protein